MDSFPEWGLFAIYLLDKSEQAIFGVACAKPNRLIFVWGALRLTEQATNSVVLHKAEQAMLGGVSSQRTEQAKHSVVLHKTGQANICLGQLALTWRIQCYTVPFHYLLRYLEALGNHKWGPKRHWVTKGSGSKRHLGKIRGGGGAGSKKHWLNKWGGGGGGGRI